MPVPYFPVELPHRLPGPQRKLGHLRAGTTCIEIDAALPAYVDAKRLASVHRFSDTTDDEHCVRAWLRETLGREHPSHPATAERLDGLVRGIQEDVVIMRRAPATAPTAVWLHVAFASSWCPACTLGRSFAEIHAPVPALHRFEAAHRARHAETGFVPHQTTVRFVWTLAPDDRLDRRRCADGVHASAPVGSWDDATTAWLRVERQVLVPLSDTLGVFLIRIHQHDVRELSRAQRDTLRASLAGMEDALAAYKGLLAAKPVIDRLLAG